MMNRKQFVYNYILLFFISASLYADELSEAFIEIKTNDRYDSFFRVLLDDETPYLNISTLLPLLYGLDKKCDNDHCNYFVALRPDEGQTTINFKERYCNSTAQKKQHHINIHYIEEQYWLHWKDIEICFNANVYWDTDSYILKIQTQYLSPTDIQKGIDHARNISMEKADQIKKLATQPRILPTNTTMIQNRLSVSSQYNTHQIDTEVASDFFFVTTYNLSIYQCNLIAIISFPIIVISMRI